MQAMELEDEVEVEDTWAADVVSDPAAQSVCRLSKAAAVTVAARITSDIILEENCMAAEF